MIVKNYKKANLVYIVHKILLNILNDNVIINTETMSQMLEICGCFIVKITIIITIMTIYYYSLKYDYFQVVEYIL